MSLSNYIITAPVSITDIKTCLSVSSNEIGVLATSTKINKWAKYKPVNGTFPQSSDGNYGLSVSTYTAAADVINNWASAWAYTNRPQGGINSPYRFGDFDFTGYYHLAEAPVHIQMAPGQTDPDKLNVIVWPDRTQATVYFMATTSVYSVKLTELNKLSALGSWKIGCIVKNANGVISLYNPSGNNNTLALLEEHGTVALADITPTFFSSTPGSENLIFPILYNGSTLLALPCESITAITKNARDFFTATFTRTWSMNALTCTVNFNITLSTSSNLRHTWYTTGTNVMRLNITLRNYTGTVYNKEFILEAGFCDKDNPYANNKSTSMKSVSFTVNVPAGTTFNYCDCTLTWVGLGLSKSDTSV